MSISDQTAYESAFPTNGGVVTGTATINWVLLEITAPTGHTTMKHFCLDEFQEMVRERPIEEGFSHIIVLKLKERKVVFYFKTSEQVKVASNAISQLINAAKSMKHEADRTQYMTVKQ